MLASNIARRGLFLCLSLLCFCQCAPPSAQVGASGPPTATTSTTPHAAAPTLTAGLTYTGMCDGSAAAALDEQTFVVASDEATLKTATMPSRNLLGVYRLDKAGPPVQTLDLTPALAPEPNNTAQHDPEHMEADIEGAARLGDRIYWLTSHGHNAKGKRRVDRYRFFATDATGGALRLAGAGTPFPAYMRLLADMGSDPRLAPFKLGELDAGNKAPEEGGVNIEGLSATRDGKLLVAFRSPLAQGKALLVPLENGRELIEGKAAQAKFGGPVLLDLGGLGIRDIAYSQSRDVYIIIAGPASSEGAFKLYQWSGKPEQPPVVLKDQAGKEIDLAGLNPEALVVLPHSNQLLLLSDDGDLKVKSPSLGTTLENKELPDAERSFRTARLTLP